MHFSVSHSTKYTYSKEVWLGPHLIRLRPRPGGNLNVIAHAIQIHPEPVALEETLDAEGNLVHLAWFDRPSASLAIATRFEVKTSCKNPYRFVVTEPDSLQLPAAYRAQADTLAPYRVVSNRDGPVAKLATELCAKTNGNTLAFLNEALGHFADYQPCIRERGPPLPPEETLAQKTGACRDIATLFVELCRLQGLAARFVSGYWHGHRETDTRQLHAWGEVYLPGAGWRGMDPSSGLAVAEAHVPITATARPEDASPVQGSFHGPPGTTSDMEWSIQIHVKPH